MKYIHPCNMLIHSKMAVPCMHVPSVGDDSLVNLSTDHVVLRNKRAAHSTT